MKNQKLALQYPWYNNHYNATHLLAKYLGLEVETTLKKFDNRIKRNSVSK